MSELVEYNVIFSEILNSYSIAYHSKLGEIYIKHLSYLEMGMLDSKYNSFLHKAKSSNMPTYKEREDSILEEGLWKRGDELEVVSYTSMLKNMEANHSKSFIASERERMRKSIEDTRLSLNALLLKKNHYIGNTAESYANKKMTFYKISSSFFKNRECTIRLIEDSDDISQEEYDEFISIYINIQDRFNMDNIKKVALSSFFISLFSLCADSAYNFYGKSMVNLTSYQVNLFILGHNFKDVIRQMGGTITDDVRNNPDELLETIEMRNNAKEAKIIGDEDNNGGSGSIPGATKADLARLGIQVVSTSKLKEELRKAGGTLTKEDLMRMET